jgi:hypothetical protein
MPLGFILFKVLLAGGFSTVPCPMSTLPVRRVSLKYIPMLVTEYKSLLWDELIQVWLFCILNELHSIVYYTSLS